ncbi:hypothetical protein [Legionella saoudiensis]|uniref:hypothetical protein n=1 Tax=Legionella saoudiensis TaxID=1750561 RepID=UPI000730AED2|nr:hypothetical protein [Legionella saoudiensis]
MSQNKLDNQQLIFFQNLVPGTQNSPFIDRYKDTYLKDEPPNSERKLFLNAFPPVLSFYEKQKKEFYDKEAENCTQFCCGAMGVSNSIDGSVSFKNLDKYMFSSGSGTLYEGSANNIKSQIQNDIQQSGFGSKQQNDLIAGLQQFNSAISERTQRIGLESPLSEMTGPDDSPFNPFKTSPTPPKE